jgi:hypothetical protein
MITKTYVPGMTRHVEHYYMHVKNYLLRQNLRIYILDMRMHIEHRNQNQYT